MKKILLLVCFIFTVITAYSQVLFTVKNLSDVQYQTFRGEGQILFCSENSSMYEITYTPSNVANGTTIIALVDGQKFAEQINDLNTSSADGSETKINAGTNVSSITGSGTLADPYVINVSSGTSTVGDGDYGDVIVSSGGTVWTVTGGGSTQVATISDLSSLTPSDNDRIYVEGYYSQFDGGEGYFIYDANLVLSTTNANSGSIIDPASMTTWDGTQSDINDLITEQSTSTNTGAWVREEYYKSGIFTSGQVGIVNDTTIAQDIAFDNAIASLQPTQSLDLKYLVRIDNDKKILKEQTTLMSSNRQGGIYMAVYWTPDGKIRPESYSTIDGCRFIISRLAAYGQTSVLPMVVQLESDDEHVTIKNCVFDIDGERGAGQYRTFNNQHIRLVGANHIVENCEFYDSKAGIYINGSSLWTVKECYFTRCDDGIKIAIGDNFSYTITESIFEENYRDHIDITSGGYGGLISNNIFRNARAKGFDIKINESAGYVYEGNKDTYTLTITGNSFYQDDDTGAIVFTSDQFIYVPREYPEAEFIRSVIISDNTMYGSRFIDGNAKNILVANNVHYDAKRILQLEGYYNNFIGNQVHFVESIDGASGRNIDGHYSNYINNSWYGHPTQSNLNSLPMFAFTYNNGLSFKGESFYDMQSVFQYSGLGDLTAYRLVYGTDLTEENTSLITDIIIDGGTSLNGEAGFSFPYTVDVDDRTDVDALVSDLETYFPSATVIPYYYGLNIEITIDPNVAVINSITVEEADNTNTTVVSATSSTSNPTNNIISDCEFTRVGNAFKWDEGNNLIFRDNMASQLTSWFDYNETGSNDSLIFIDNIEIGSKAVEFVDGDKPTYLVDNKGEELSITASGISTDITLSQDDNNIYKIDISGVTGIHKLNVTNAVEGTNYIFQIIGSGDVEFPSSFTTEDVNEALQIVRSQGSALVQSYYNGTNFISNTTSDRYTTSNILLENYTGAEAAYALRKLSGAYTGSAIRVKRDSDNTESDIGFNGIELDEAALTTFCGANTCTVVTFYDQSGNSRDLITSAAFTPPTIVNAGTLNTLNGKPAISFNGSTDVLHELNVTYTYNAPSAAAIVFSGTQSYSAIFNIGNTIATGIFKLNSDDLQTRMDNVLNTPNTVNDGTQKFGYMSHTSTELLVGTHNGNEGTLATPNTTSYNDRLVLGARANVPFGSAAEYFNGNIQEVILWSGDKSSDIVDIKDEIKLYYDDALVVGTGELIPNTDYKLTELLTANFTVSIGKYNLVDPNGGAITATVPSGVTQVGTEFWVVDSEGTASGTNTITVDFSTNGYTVSGQNTAVINDTGDGFKFIYIGSNKWISERL